MKKAVAVDRKDYERRSGLARKKIRQLEETNP